ncbi:MAG TPA: 3D domain-containing protein [Pyrinomonadaceae bacterium]|nr:3D domain-containing protein [Pyrinomonadaceae bacterium]
MKKSTFLGSTVSVLLTFSVISHARTEIQQQDPKAVSQASQTTSGQSSSPAEAPKPETTATQPTEPRPAATQSLPGVAPETSSTKPIENVVILAENYTATAYSLRGRTASGRSVARGVIAADPRFLPIGTRVRVDAGPWSGEYVVADTGGAVKGHRIDIWTPTAGEAMRFGRRLVKLTVLELGGKRKKNPVRQPVVVPASLPVATEPQTKGEKN